METVSRPDPEGIPLLPDPDLHEILRYMGYRGDAPGSELLAEIGECVRDLQKAVTPRYVYERFPLGRKDRNSEGEIPCFADLEVVSRDLSQNLKDCREVCLMAVTLGTGPDLLVRRASVTRVSRALIYQAAAAAMTETWCGMINERIRKEAEIEGLYTRPRFSPGYGDLPLTLQRDISRILNMPKEIGVSLTETLLMTPSKSVTALIGLSGTPKDCRTSHCEACPASADCPYRERTPQETYTSEKAGNG